MTAVASTFCFQQLDRPSATRTKRSTQNSEEKFKTSIAASPSLSRHFPAVMPQVMVAVRHLCLVLYAYFGWFCAKERTMPAGYAIFPPLCQDTVAMRRVCLGRSSYASYSNLWQSLCPSIKSGPGISQPILMLLPYLAWFPMPSGHLTRASNVPNPRSRGGIGTYGTFFACSRHSLCPKSKWHLPPQPYGFAYGSYSQLCQSLCPPNGSKPNSIRSKWKTNSFGT